MPAVLVVRSLLLAAIILTLDVLLPRRVGKSDMSPETRVIATVRAIHTAETQYYSQYGRYASTLQELQPLIDGSLTGGYRFALAGNPGGYVVLAVPEVLRAGSRTFYSDQTMVVHEHYGPGPATAQDPELK